MIDQGNLRKSKPTKSKKQMKRKPRWNGGKESLIQGYALYAGGIWKGVVLIADLEELETMDASEIYSKRLNAKEVTFPKQGEFIFQSQMDEPNPLEEIRN